MKNRLRPSALSLALTATLLGSATWSTAGHACAFEPYLGSVCIMATPNGFGNFGNTYTPAQGQLLSINQYTALFAVMGTTWGGDGRTTVGVPDLRGRVVVGSGQSPSLGATFTAGQNGGAISTTLTLAQLPQHNHALTGAAVDISKMTATTTMTGVSATVSGLKLNASNSAVTSNDPTGNTLGLTTGLGARIYNSATPSVEMNAGNISGGSVGFSGNPTTTLGGTVTVSGSTTPTGLSQPLPLMQPYLVMNYYLATNGIFPTRD